MLRLAVGSAAAVAGAVGVTSFYHHYGHQIGLETVDAGDLSIAEKVGMSQTPLPSREEQLTALQTTEEYDVLVIGGGATGCGVALEAVTRGLKTALVEKFDYSCGTSSRSTKLIHGGVRYLQSAIMKLDMEQYKLVKEALHERANLLAVAPHLSKPLPIMLPVYKLWQVPYFWAGIKMYDLVAGRQLVKSSYFVNREKALETFPMLKADSLCGAIVYYDGQHNDSRVNIALALTAIRHGAACINHVEVTNLIKERKLQSDGSEKEVVRGAHVRDMLTGKEWKIRAKCVVNATGPFTDVIRRLDDPLVPKICQPSAGVHIVLPDYYSPSNMGLLDPQTSDGRVIFFLPWEGKTIAGTTDSPCEVSFSPAPTETEIQFILKEIKDYLSSDIHVRRGDVLAAWSGIRPLVTDPSSKDTKSLSRNHVIHVSDSNMVTIAGGKWTTYRAMASDTVDAAIKATDLKPKSGSRTDGLTLEGGEGWTPTLFIRLVQDFGLEPEVAQHLSRSYGNKAPQVAKMAKLTGKRWPVVGVRLVEDFPYIEAEVKYGISEYAQTAVDMLARRTRLAFLSVQAADEALPKIVEIMSQELGWDDKRKQVELKEARHFLEEMGNKSRVQVRNVPVNFSWSEVDNLTKIFKRFDLDDSGHVTAPAIRKMLSELGENDISDDQLQQLIAEVDLNMNNTIELEEFLQLMSAFRTGAVSHNRLATLVDRHYQFLLDCIPTDRSGGGV